MHFDGSTYLYINPLVVSDSPVLSASMWIKTSLLKTNGLFDFDPNNNAAPDLSIDNNHNAFNFYENQNGGIFLEIRRRILSRQMDGGTIYCFLLIPIMQALTK